MNIRKLSPIVLLILIANACTWIDKSGEEQKLQPIIRLATSKIWIPYKEIEYEEEGYSKVVSSRELSGGISQSTMSLRSESLSFHSADGLDTCDNQLFLGFGEYSVSYNYFRDSGFFLWNAQLPKKRYALIPRGNMIEILYRREVSNMFFGGHVEYKGILFR